MAKRRGGSVPTGPDGLPANRSGQGACVPSIGGYSGDGRGGGLQGALSRVSDRKRFQELQEAEERGKAKRRDERKKTQSSRGLERMQQRRSTWTSEADSPSIRITERS